MGKIARRAIALGVLAAALLLPGTALADPADPADPVDPAIAGSCDATLRDGAPGQPLTVDAGAPLNAPHVATVGTGSGAANKPALSLPVADLAKSLNVGDLPRVGAPLTDTLCPGAQNTVNALSATTQTLLSGKPKDPPAPSPAPKPPGKNPPPSAKPSPQPPSTPAPAPSTPVVSPATPAGEVPSVSPPLNVAPQRVTNLSALIAPGAVAPSAPGVVPPVGTGPGIVNQNSGTAEALPASATTPEKLPLLLSAIALALVAGALSRVWIRRSIK